MSVPGFKQLSDEDHVALARADGERARSTAQAAQTQATVAGVNNVLQRREHGDTGWGVYNPTPDVSALRGAWDWITD